MKLGWPIGDLRLRYAWLPKKVSETEWIWFEHCTERRVSEYRFERKYKDLKKEVSNFSGWWYDLSEDWKTAVYALALVLFCFFLIAMSAVIGSFLIGG